MFFETTIMGKTADLAMVQKTPSTTRVSHRRSLLKGVAVHRVLYQSILNAKLTGRKKLGRNRCTSNRDDRKLENTVKQSRFKHLGELHKEWTEAGVSASRVTTLRRLLKQKQCQKHLTWAKEKNNWTVAQWSKVLFSDKSKFCISFGNHVGPLCFIKSKVNAAVYQEILEHFMLPSADKIYADADFLFHLPTVSKPLPSCLLTMILLCLIGQPTCLT